MIAPEDPAAAAPFVELAQASGVRRVVLLSGRAITETPPEFFQGMYAAEQALRASGLSWTILRANNFNQNFSEEVWQSEVRAGRLSLPADDTPEPFVDVQDIADVAALALTSSTSKHEGRTYDLTGPTAISFSTAIEKISVAAGRPIEFVQVKPEEYRDMLLGFGVSEHETAELNAMYEGMRNGLFTTPTDDISQVLGRDAIDFDTYVEGAVPAWR